MIVSLSKQHRANNLLVISKNQRVQRCKEINAVSHRKGKLSGVDSQSYLHGFIST